MKNALHPFDVVVALKLSYGGASYQSIASELDSSPSQVHAAVRRLRNAGLLRPDAEKLSINRSALREFIIHGLRYAFPARPGTVVRGVPTAHAGPVLAGEIDAMDPLVWPSPDGDLVGQAIEPLYPRATSLPRRSPKVYALLTLVDALRVGTARERNLAREKLTMALAPIGASG